MEEKEAYRKKQEAQLKEFNAKIEQLEAKAEQADAEARMKYHTELEKLKMYRTVTQEKLQEMTRASGEAFTALKQGTEKAFSDLGDALDEAIAKFK